MQRLLTNLSKELYKAKLLVDEMEQSNARDDIIQPQHLNKFKRKLLVLIVNVCYGCASFMRRRLTRAAPCLNCIS